MKCKRHKWRVGSGIGKLVNGRLIVGALNIWCERCDKKIKAKYHSDVKVKMFKKGAKN